MSDHTLQTISVALDLKEATTRRWTVMLEQSGYLFQKDNRRRIYTDADLETLKRVKELVNGLTAEGAVAVVMEQSSRVTDEGVDLSVEIAEMDDFIARFKNEYFWNAEKSLQDLHQYWKRLKNKLSIQAETVFIERVEGERDH